MFGQTKIGTSHLVSGRCPQRRWHRLSRDQAPEQKKSWRSGPNGLNRPQWGYSGPYKGHILYCMKLNLYLYYIYI